MNCDDGDIQTTQLIIELQLADLEPLLKGKHREGEVEDGEFAFEAYKAELESLADFASDQIMARSIARAVESDGDAIVSNVELEDQAAQDRVQALGRTTGIPTPSGSTCEKDPLDDELLQKLKALYMDDGSVSEVGDEGESSRWAASRSSTSTIGSRTCIACDSAVPFFDVARCPCSHEYCRTCLAELFNAATIDESLFPPRCCKQPIPLGLNQMFLPSGLVANYKAKAVEYNTPNRTYCCRPTCSAFIPLGCIQADNGVCPQCQHLTCAICKGPPHEADCPEDPGTQEVLRLAKDEGWRQCYSCHRLVELKMGCNHITCLCRAQFCYLCGAPWKNCPCDAWQEERIYMRANDIIDRDPRVAGIGAAERYARVEEERQNLIVNHECVHESWRSRQGTYRCEECRDILPIFIYECRQCRILACRRCRYNRL